MEPTLTGRWRRAAALDARGVSCAAWPLHHVLWLRYPQGDDSDVFPDCPPYPEAARGLQLGTSLYYVLTRATNRQKYSHVLEELKAVGFPVDVDWKQHVWDRQQRAGLRASSELHGNVQVPMLFVVPTGDARWPIETWGFTLGRFATNLRHRDHRRHPQEHLGDLEAMNAAWELKKLTHVERLALLAPTIKVFCAHHGHFLMPSSFVVPRDGDARWPDEARGQMLGYTLHCLMARASERRKHPDVIQALREIGFPVDVDWKQYVWQRQQLAALRVYRALHGNLRVPRVFVVPPDDTRWPIETRGMKLGRYSNNIRTRDHRYLTQEQLDQLDALGFWWGRHGRRQLKEAYVQQLNSNCGWVLLGARPP